MNHINLYHLRYFVDAAEKGGISHSARKNYVTQSAVSRAISSLEKELGIELMVHRQNQFQLTEAGEMVVEKSEGIFAAASHLRETAAEHSKTFRGPLRFGCNQAIASHLLGTPLALMEMKYPDVRPEIQLGNTDQIQDMLEKRETDFGIVVDDGQVQSRFQLRKIFTDELLVVQAPQFKRDPFENLIVSRVQKGGLSQKYFREYRKVHGEAPSPKLVVASWQVIMDFAVAGYGAALVPRFICKEPIRQKKLKLVRSRMEPVSFDLCTIVKKSQALPRNAEAFLECFAEGSRH